MMRDWRRLYRLRGFAPFGMVLVVLLAVLVMADRAAERWAAAAQRRDAAERQLATMGATLGRSRSIDASLESARARLAAVSGRLASASDPAAAGERLAHSAKTWLASLGITGSASAAASHAAASGSRIEEPDGGARASVAAAEITARVMPRQLLRMLAQWDQATLAMRLVRLEVTVDNPDAPTALDAMLRVEAAYQSPRQDGRARASGSRPAKARDAR